ncbi:aspartate-semialdehyde dehydrogenase [Atractiella rhizophila]|nr:aspartate-semialdehyde dehydrogenase [Atractiella rhizophila]
MMERRTYTVGVLGATGTVGQKFILLLADHPFFSLTTLGASPRSANQQYKAAVKWKQSDAIPESVQKIVLVECTPDNFKGCDLVFSGLDSSVAGEIEGSFRDSNIMVFSNSKNYRRDPLVPLMVPLVNPSHLSLLRAQKSALGLSKGCILTNANCSTTGLVIPLAALEESFGPISRVAVTTLQAISGAGYPGVPSLDIHDNVVPYIEGEEEKMEWETRKILGSLSSQGSTLLRGDGDSPEIRVSASCNRVPVLEGHTLCVSVEFLRRPPPSPEQVGTALGKWSSPAHRTKSRPPSLPEQAIFVHGEDEPDRPQPRLDRNFQRGAGVSVGRIRRCNVFDIKFVVLANNVAIGAATSSIINAEIAVQQGYFS